MIVLSLALLLTGWYSAAFSTTAPAPLRAMVDRANRSPNRPGALQLLSIADASASRAFCPAACESPTLRTRCADAIATATTSLITRGGQPDGRGRGGLGKSSPKPARTWSPGQEHPVYTGLVETARTTTGSAILSGPRTWSVASTLMQKTILPAAQRVYRRSAAISDPQQTLSTPPWGCTRRSP